MHEPVVGKSDIVHTRDDINEGGSRLPRRTLLHSVCVLGFGAAATITAIPIAAGLKYMANTAKTVVTESVADKSSTTAVFTLSLIHI